MDFERSIFENRAALGRPFLAAHRGGGGANIPCNTLAAYKIALDQGADASCRCCKIKEHLCSEFTKIRKGPARTGCPHGPLYPQGPVGVSAAERGMAFCLLPGRGAGSGGKVKNPVPGVQKKHTGGGGVF